LPGRWLEDGVQQADQRRFAFFASKNVLEGVIDLGIDLDFHTRNDNRRGARFELEI
jgi:hypothetical protein